MAPPQPAPFADEPGNGGFFTITHFDGYAAVLVQLRRAKKRVLREAIVDAWLVCAPTKLAEEYLG